ncbi:MDR family MFS transporter [Ktedonospora formicarum]|uniref:MFS transporter n=1 Tax=Ktedonospora formicarum TaxID=2778364 RepID=A0A8J3I6A4_9CHLR|nr:MDR family MFS transporter [Ktedonospora formicarum]GHO46159.1 MFS transporter [Ktedonospora formicarum]
MAKNTLETHSHPGSRLKGFALASVIVALMLSLFLEALDQTIVGTAMPRIIAELHGLDRYTWVVTAYVLASMTMIPIVGKLSDQFGRKWFLLGGTSLFLVGSLLAGASQTMNQLIIFRALQGLGAGIGMALIATVLGDLFPPEERAKWGSLFGIVYGISNLFGPTLGGWLTEHGPLIANLVAEHSRWRWVFYINLPVGLIAVAALLFFLPNQLSVRTSEWNGWGSVRRVDFLGSLISAVATICLMLGLTWGSSRMYAWNSFQVMGLIGISVILFILFTFVEKRAEEPILPLSLFHNQTFSMVTLLSMLQMMVLMGLSLYLPLFLQGVLAVSPTMAGLVMTPLSISMVLGAMLAGPLVSALKRARIIAIIGAAVMVTGCLLITLMTIETNLFLAIVFMILAGIGTGTFFFLPTLAQNALPQSQLGVGTAATRYLGQLGATLGIAIVGTVVSGSMTGGLDQRLPTTLAEKLQFAGALQHGFIAVLIFTVIALLATFFLKDIPITTSTEEAISEEANTALHQEPAQTPVN